MKSAFLIGAAALAAAIVPSPANAAGFTFSLLPAQTNCETDARGKVTITKVGRNHKMHVVLKHLPKRKVFEVFITQVPNAPFGMSWYQGDIKTDDTGFGSADFIGIFNKETFIVAPGIMPAPQTFATSAGANPVTAPIQMYHVGVWFDSPAAAVASGCANTVTPFNGPHNAGVQVLSTKQFADTTGPLLQVP